jgi:hypothetical protein
MKSNLKFVIADYVREGQFTCSGVHDVIFRRLRQVRIACKPTLVSYSLSLPCRPHHCLYLSVAQPVGFLVSHLIVGQRRNIDMDFYPIKWSP